jgi:hypothetical protein
LQTIFLARVAKIKEESEAQCLTLSSKNSGLGGGKVKEERDQEEKEAATLGWIGSVTNWLPMPAATVENCRWAQNTLGWHASSIQSFYSLWTWQDSSGQGSPTFSLAIGIGVSMLLHLPFICNFWTIAYVEILLLFFTTTSYFKQVMGAISGLASYYTTSIARTKAKLQAAGDEASANVKQD